MVMEALMSKHTQLSVRRIAKELGVKRSTALYHLHNGDYEKVEPLTVGSMKTTVNVWRTQSRSQ